MKSPATALGLLLVALALGACAAPRQAAPATPAAPAVAKTPVTPHATGRPELRYYEISAA